MNHWASPSVEVVQTSLDSKTDNFFFPSPTVPEVSKFVFISNQKISKFFVKEDGRNTALKTRVSVQHNVFAM